MNTLQDLVAEQARRHPEACALICADRRISYGDLDRRSDRTAAAIRAAGLAPGARLAYLGQESEHYYDVLFGAAKSATVLVPVNWRLAAAEVEHILRDSTAGLLFVEGQFRHLVDAVVDRLPSRPSIVELDGTGLADWKRTGEGDTTPQPDAGPDDPVAQLYTSGTTGLPKGVVLAHRSFFAVRDALRGAGLDWIDFRPDDVSLVAVPGFHIGGLWWAVQGLAAGIPNVLLRMFVSHDAIEAVRTHRVTTTCVVPSMLTMLLNEPGVTPADFGCLRKVAYGGSPIAEALLHRCFDVIGCEFVQLYGLTETGNTAVCLPPAEHVGTPTRLAAAGRPYPGFGLTVTDRDGTEVPVGEIGEIRIRTPGRMIEYFGQPDASAETLVDGWIRTGDAGYLDADGYVYVCDRIKDMVIVAGENLYPAEIERVLAGHPGVREAAVVGRPDDRWGEALHAFVVAAPDTSVTKGELVRYLRGRIATHKIPTSFDLVDALPRNPSGKVLRRELRARFWHERTRQVN